MDLIKDFGICNLSVTPLRKEADDASEIVSQLLFGDFVEIIEKGTPWIKIKNHYDGYEGWMDFKQLVYISESQFKEGVSVSHPVLKQETVRIMGPKGVQKIMLGSSLPFLSNNQLKLGDETYKIIDLLDIQANINLLEIAHIYLNTPYLWGGKSIFGIDCSGFTQNVFKTIGIFLPRDASKQVNYGKEIAWDDKQPGDLVYFTSKSGKVTHVGILLENNKIIHAHGRVRIDELKLDGIWNDDLNCISHTFHSIKRI